MASFYSMFGFLAVGSFAESDPGTFDMLSRLPVEMAQTILRLLPAKDLLNAVRVSTKWLKLCKSDPKLRQKVRRYLRQMRRGRLAVVMGERPGVRGRARDDPVLRNVTNAGRTSNSSLRDNGVQSGGRVHRVPLPYQRDLLERPKKIRNVKIVDLSLKTLRI